MNVEFSCPVRGCQQPLARNRRTFFCPRGHSFDVARSGYVNLSQPQDKKSKSPGDSVEAVLARRRLNDARLGEGLAGVLVQMVPGLFSTPEPAVLDVGCGEGFLLARISAAIGGQCVGVDLSTTAIELAAKRYPGIEWIVANGDRTMPFAPGSFDLIFSITSRHHSAEYRRLLGDEGHLVVVIPAADDLIELRQAVMGQGRNCSRTGAIVRTYQPHFELKFTETFRERRELDRSALLDLLASTYRGGRKSQGERIGSLKHLQVTLSRDILVFRPRGESVAP